MKQTLLTALLFLTVSTTAHAQAQCLSVHPGGVVINHRTGYLYGGNFVARVACTWKAPVFVYWPGGYFCSGRTLYGHNLAGAPFSCRVLSVGMR